MKTLMRNFKAAGKAAGLVTSIIAGLTMIGASNAQAQAKWPQKPVRLVVPFAAGGSTDVSARLLADKLTAELGQQVAVENIGGAGGMIGAAQVSAATADGYTVLFGTSTMSTIKVFYKDSQIDTLRDFIPASIISTGVTTLIVNPQVGVKTAEEFIAKSKTDPISISFGTPGMGTASLTMEMMKSRAGLDAQVIHYKGAGPAMVGLHSNEIQAMFEPTLTAKPLVDAGQAVALATTGLTRSPVFPDVPTLTEVLGSPFDGSFYNGMFLKVGTPPEVVERLTIAVKNVLALPDVRQKLIELGQQPVGSTEAEFRAKLEKEIPQWIEIGKAAGVEPQ